MTSMRFAWLAIALAGCSEWTPIRNARDVDGQRVRVEIPGRPDVDIDALVLCDDKGFVIASTDSECRGDSKVTYDTRREKILVHDGETKSNVGIVVTAVLAAIFVPIGIVGTAILTSH